MGWLASVLTVAGYLIGAWIGGPFAPALGALVGAFVGSYLDPNKSSDPPTIDEIQVQGFTEGDPMQRSIGRACRTAGEVIWTGPFASAEPGVAKPGHDVQYAIPIAVSFGRTFTSHGIKKITHLFANGQLLYWNTDDVSVTGTDIAATLVSVSDFDPGTGTSTVIQTYLDLTTSGTDLSAFSVAGLADSIGQATVAGWSGGSAANNGTFIVVSSGTTSMRLKHPTLATYAFVTAAAGPTIAITQVGGEHIVPTQTKFSQEFTVYLGTPTQGQDPTIVAYEGAANTPAFRGTVYVVWAALGLNFAGVSIPRFEAVLRERDDTDLPIALRDLIAGTTDLDICDIDSLSAVGIFQGYSTRGAKTALDFLSPLLIAYNLTTQEKDGYFRVVHRLGVDEDALEEHHIGAYEGEDATPQDAFVVEREDPKRLPREVTLRYLDPDLSWQTGSKTARRLNLPLDNVIEHQFPLTLSGDQATQITKRILYGETVAGTRILTRLPPSKLLTTESMRLSATRADRDYVFLTSRVARGANWLLEIEALADDKELHANESAEGGEVLNDGGGSETATGDPALRLADVAPLADADAYTPTLYYGASRETPSLAWAGADVYESSDAVTYSQIDALLAESESGLTASALASGPVGVWDLGSTLTVDFASGTSPSSSTDDAVLAGLVNWYLVGGEVVGVVTWTLVSGTRYAGTRLARGLMDTAEQVGLHAAVESVVEIRSSGALGVKTYTPGLVGSLRYYKTAALNGDPASMTAKTITLNASSIRPFAPCDVAGARNDPSSNDWTLTWKPRTRLPLWDTLGAIPFDDAESSEVYELEVWDSTYATLKRTITATASGNGSVITTTTPNAPSCLYDADDQVADFGSAQATIYLRIFQVGASSGLRSKKLQVSFTG